MRKKGTPSPVRQPTRLAHDWGNGVSSILPKPDYIAKLEAERYVEIVDLPAAEEAKRLAEEKRARRAAKRRKT